MAYNLESLVTVLERILSPDQRWFFDQIVIPQIESLLEKTCFLRDTLAKSATLSGYRKASFDDLIRDTVQNAEDVLETYVADHLSEQSRSYSNLLDLQKLLGDFDSAKEEMMKILDDAGVTSSASAPAVSSTRDLNPDKALVGVTDDLIQLKDRVLGESTKLEIIPIVGMGGIGKTTLARNIYNDLSVAQHFDVRAWTMVSNDYSLKNILLGLLSCMTGRHTDELIQQIDESRLGVTLHKKLIGKRYLIVLDDIWRSKAWDDVKMFFPNEKNGSRIILTTRESGLATYVDSRSPHHQVHPLNKVESWKLLREMVFGDETCPLEFEELGIKIANDCAGLPLAICVIGGILSHTKKSIESWEQVADDVSTAIANKVEQFSRILSLSYDHLPYHLRPCFLYMSAFPEDYVISASKLIRLWVAEGFIKPIEGKSLVEAAEEYLNALVDRNLILASQRQKTSGKVKSCLMHDFLRDLSVSKSRQEKFFHVMNGQTHNIPEDKLCFRRVSLKTLHSDGDHIHDSIGQMPLARSLIFTGRKFLKTLSPTFSVLRLLRVLDVLGIQFDRFPEIILKLVNLRYLAFTCKDELDPRITILTNLQTLIVRLMREAYLTPEIFNMPSLREIRFLKHDTHARWKVVWCDVKEWTDLVLQVNLQSLSTLEISNLDKVIRKSPNLKKLGILYSNRSQSLVTDLTCLCKLETLKLSIDHVRKVKDLVRNVTFPVSLKKLSLNKCRVSKSCMKKIGVLPNLEILKLNSVVFKSETWEPSEGEYCRLQLLRLENVRLTNWRANETHFPSLRHLILDYPIYLKEIPSGIGEISTLKTIELFSPKQALVDSARKIQDEQLEFGNDLLQVHVFGSIQDKVSSLEENVMFATYD